MATTGRGRRVGNLPAETTSFVGRQTELDHLNGLLERARLVTLAGVGGVGKTRLALRAANGVRAGFPDGVWLVELSSLQDPALVGHVVLETLPLADQTARPPVEVLAEWLADKRLLLVLDTCEHLVEACAQITDTLLEATPGLHVLASSRQPLDLPAEREVVVQPLPVSTHPCADAEENGEAVMLFAQRAATAAPGFVLDEDNQETAAGICRRLDGIPLAIELAAARLSELTVDQLSERLHSRFDLLTAQDTDRPGQARHQTLRTTIGWSHELCAPLERLLWARLSVFPDGFDNEAAESVCSGGPLPARDVLRALNALVDKSIVRREEPEDAECGAVRYRMRDTVREYGARWLRELGEEEQVHRHHRDFYLRLARRGDAEYMGPDQVAWYERMVAEHANLRTALEVSLAEPDGRTALELAGALWFFWFACGFHREGRRYLEQALAKDLRPGPERTRALWACSMTAMVQGENEAGLRLGTACRSAAQQQEDPEAVLAATYPIASCLTLLGEPARGATVYDEAAPVPARGSGYREAGRLLSRLGRALNHIVQGEFPQGAALAVGVRAECSPYGEQWLRSAADWLEAMTELAEGRAASAAAHARDAIKGWHPLHNIPGIALTLDTLAPAVAAQGYGKRAARLLGITQRIWQMVGRPQMGSPELIAAREACEHRTREAVGDAAYEAEYRAGLETEPEDGIAYALVAPPYDE
ncbi:ATP-binding protein [Allosalinactinospora lopnorensis]|uniref:ATP-binding protein n=1 Tax=Allosalinactinospora lopnorensis TaxID=1352348 RepID=UPI000623F059|nr:hypothetical protein [Allosalinactinospora lopnorensis]